MRSIFLWLLLVFIPLTSYSQTLFLKDGTTIETDYYWVENTNNMGYWLNGETKFIEKDKIDFNRIEREKTAKQTMRFTDDNIEQEKFNKQPLRFSDDDIATHNSNGSGDFRGLRWGISTSEVDDLVHIGTDESYGGVERYIRSNDSMVIGCANLERIEYGFWRDQLMTVFINCNGFSNYTCLKDATFKKFGAGFKGNRFMEQYSWHELPATFIMLEYSEIKKEAKMWFMSNEITKKAEQHNKEKAAEGALQGF